MYVHIHTYMYTYMYTRDTGTEAGQLRIYARGTREFKKELRAHIGGVYCLVSNLERTQLYSGSNDFTVYEWDVAKRCSLRMLAGHSNGVRCALCVGLHLWTGSDDFTVKVCVCMYIYTDMYI